MSGPTVVLIPVPPEPSLLLMSAVALLAADAVRRAAQSVADAQTEAEALKAHHTRAEEAHRQALQAADAQHHQALQTEHQAMTTRWARLCEAAAAAGCAVPVSAPETPEATAPASVWAAHVRAMQSLADQLLRVIEQHNASSSAHGASAARLDELDGAVSTDLASVLAAYAQRQPPALLASVQRILGRVAHLPWPAELEALVGQLARPLSTERAEALLVELRHQTQALQQTEIARAQAVVLAHTLQDLGYELEEMGDTLFVEGGVLHFRKPGWGDYLVRLRFNAQQRTANFNVIRAVDEGENERSVLDHLAEDRWCAEFPALLAALEARGLPMQVVRRLEAGELPVQRVLRNKLPPFASTEAEADAAWAHRPAPLQRRLN